VRRCKDGEFASGSHPLIVFASLGTSPEASIHGFYPLTPVASLGTSPKGRGNFILPLRGSAAPQGLAEEGVWRKKRERLPGGRRSQLVGGSWVD
jgi:hypothetical protein